MRTSVFPDTNTYLHYLCLDEVAWAEVAGTKDVELVIPMTVIEELDSFKHEHSRRGSRAREVLSRITRLFDDAEERVPMKNGIEVILDISRGIAGFDFLGCGLNPQRGDDRVLAAALTFGAACPDRKVLVVTADPPMSYKARHHKVAVAKPLGPALKGEEDPSAKLQKQIDAMTKAVPQLTLAFTDGQQQMEVILPLDGPTATTLAHDKKHARFLRSPLDPERLPAFYNMALGRPTKSQITEYNESLPAWYEESDRYLDQKHANEVFTLLSFPLQLVLGNDGGRPAERTDVRITLPPGLRAYTMHQRPTEPKELPPPDLPVSSTVEFAVNLARYAHLMGKIEGESASLDGLFEREMEYEIVRSEAGDIVILSVDEVGNHEQIELDQVTVAFESFEVVQSATIPYRIRSNSIPKPIEGELRLRVERGAKK